jgi:catechol 2,3-dioxygenase-like lactoylglutathione lyase family enzyme
MTRTKIKALGEVALRVNDLEKMQAFYENVIGLELLHRFPDIVFFKIAEGFAGHTQVLALFDHEGEAGYVGVSAAQTTVDHIAFNIELSDYEAEKQRMEGLGLEVSAVEHEWVHWRSLYILDPEGNQVELVCFDPSV